MTQYRKANEALIERLKQNFFSKYSDSQVRNFIIGVDNSALKNISSGELLIPPPNFFKKLASQKEYKNIAALCLRTAILCEEYYKALFNLAIFFNDDFNEFSIEYEKIIQPIGQKIIYMIILMRLYISDNTLSSESKIYKLMNKVTIYVAKKFASDPVKTYRNINIIGFMIILLLTSLIFTFYGGLGNIIVSLTSSATIAGISLIIIASILGLNEFENRDINGKNILALKYKSVFSSEFMAISHKNLPHSKNLA